MSIKGKITIPHPYVNPDNIIKECSYLWDKAYKMAVHSEGLTDWSRATQEQKKNVFITQCVLFKAYVSRINSREQLERIEYHA